MSKIKIRQVLKVENERHEYNGLGIKKANKIIYFDNNIKTSIVIDDTVKIIRKSDYQIVLNFKEGKMLDSYYEDNYGSIKLELQTNYLKIKKNFLEIHYTLLSKGHKISDFEFILEYSIDT